MDKILALSSAIGLVTSGVVQAVKHTDTINNRYLPMLAIFIGVAIGGLATFVGVSLVERLWAGAISGLMAVGFYEVVKEDD